VEGHRAHLEQHPDAQQGQTGEQQPRRLRIGLDGQIDVTEVEGARISEGQRHTVQEDGRAECAEQEVLQRGFLAQQPAAPCHTAQDVQRERQHLESDEHGQQIVGGGEDHHAGKREQQQREDFGLLLTGGDGLTLGLGTGHRGRVGRERRLAAADPPLGEQQHRERSEEQQQHPGQLGRAVKRQRVHRGQLWRIGRPVDQRPAECADQHQQRPGRLNRRTNQSRYRTFEDDGDRATQQHQQDRCGGQKLLEHHFPPIDPGSGSVMPTTFMVVLAVCSTTLIIGCG